MIIRFWNVRGLNDPIKHSELCQLIHQERMVFFGLLKLGLETGIKIMFRNFFCVIGPSCIIMISLVVVVFGFVGMLIW